MSIHWHRCKQEGRPGATFAMKVMPRGDASEKRAADREKEGWQMSKGLPGTLLLLEEFVLPNQTAHIFIME